MIYLLIFANLVLTIKNESQTIDEINVEIWSADFNRRLIACALSFIMDPFLVIELYRYFCFFFQKKKESLTKQYGVFTCKQKALVIFCLAVFVFSGLVILLDDILELMLLCKLIKNKGPKERWYVVMYIFYEVLILTNSIMFLYFFKHMAMFQLAKRGGSLKKRKGQTQK